MAKKWTAIEFTRGYSEFRAAWQNNADAFLCAGEEMRLDSRTAQTNMPIKHIRAFLRECAPSVRITLFCIDAPID